MVTSGPLQNALLLRSDPLRLFAQLAASGDSISMIDLPAGRAHLVNEPGLVTQLLMDRTGAIEKHLLPGIRQAFGNGVFIGSGQRHALVRRAAQPSFHRLQVEAWSDEVRAILEDAFDQVEDGETNVKAFFERSTLIIAGRVLFGLDLSAVAAEFFDCAEQMQELFQRIEASPAAAECFDAASRKLDQLLQNALKEQPAAREEGPLFRALGLTAQLSDHELVEELRSFLLASIPTSLMLATTCWLLAANPQEQARLRGSDGLAWSGNVVQEALRLYPPAWIMIREATDQFELGGVSYPKGSAFIICPWTLHHEPRYFPEPERFLPDRWTRNADIPRGAYIPFSMGSRSCIGERLAQLIARLTLAPLVTRYRLLESDQHEMKWLPRITLAPRTGIWVRLQQHADL